MTYEIILRCTLCIPVSRPPQKVPARKFTTIITGNRLHQGLTHVNTANQNEVNASRSSLLNLSYKTPNTRDPSTYLNRKTKPSLNIFVKVYELKERRKNNTHCVSTSFSCKLHVVNTHFTFLRIYISSTMAFFTIQLSELSDTLFCTTFSKVNFKLNIAIRGCVLSAVS